jgi:ribosomal protein S17
MRIPKEQKQTSNQPQQCVLFEDDKYTHRIFCTNLAGKSHEVIAEYDKRADVENLVGEAKREGLDMVPSAKFKNNYAFFQIVMLAYNIWRYMKMIAQKSISGNRTAKGSVLKGIMTNTVRIARLKLLFIAAKVVNHSNRDTIKYSIHDSRTPEVLHLLEFIDIARTRPRPWHKQFIWSPRFTI